jgi:hypothetical protein
MLATAEKLLATMRKQIINLNATRRCRNGMAGTLSDAGWLRICTTSVLTTKLFSVVEERLALPVGA